MKNIYILVIFVMLAGVTVTAQNNQFAADDDSPGFYGRVSGGFGVGLCYDDPCEYEEDYLYGSYDNVNTYGAAYGTGGNVTLAGGYMFSKYVGVELGIRDFWGLKKTQQFTYQGVEGGSSNTTYKRNVMSLQIIPSIILTPGLENWNPYARFGLSMGVYNTVTETETNNTGNVETISKGKYSGGFPLGYSAALGLEYKLSGSISLTAEADCEGMNYAPNKWEIREYTVNGADHLGDLTTKQKETEFVKSYDRSESIPNDSPDKALRLYFPLSNVSLNVGAKIRF
jgi:hypothetical protein